MYAIAVQKCGCVRSIRNKKIKNGRLAAKIINNCKNDCYLPREFCLKVKPIRPVMIRYISLTSNTSQTALIANITFQIKAFFYVLYVRITLIPTQQQYIISKGPATFCCDSMFVSICHFHQGKAGPTTVPAVVRKIHFSKGKQKNSGKKMYQQKDSNSTMYIGIVYLTYLFQF